MVVYPIVLFLELIKTHSTIQTTKPEGDVETHTTLLGL